MQMKKKWLSALCGLLLSGAVLAEDANVDAYREMTYGDRDANPGLLVVDRGETLFKEKRGPKNVSLEQCDFGLGAGKLEGAYAQMPRYFADVDKVQDTETRLLHCMVELQGFDVKELKQGAFADQRMNEDNTDMETLTTYIASKSDGMKINAPSAHPKEQEAIKVGEELFWKRYGTMDFACATCHTADNSRIRLQPLVNVYSNKDIQKTMGGWPTYRVSHGVVRTMQHRMWDCHWQMRLPDVEYGSPLTTSIIAFLNSQAKDGEMIQPGMSR